MAAGRRLFPLPLLLLLSGTWAAATGVESGAAVAGDGLPGGGVAPRGRKLLVPPLGGVALKKYLKELEMARQTAEEANLRPEPDGAGGTWSGGPGAPIPKGAAEADPTCGGHDHLDLDGEAVMWGMQHKTDSAQECCDRCKAFQARGRPPKPCSMWVWCGDPSGVCWSQDIWNHTTGECWLKFQAEWDGNPNLGESNIRINQRGRFPPQFRREHRTAPEMVPWTAGVIVPRL